MKIFARLACYMQSMRYVECGGVALTALQGYWLTVHSFDVALPAVPLAMASVVCGAGFANVVNDMLDRDADRLNHPGRPIVRGALGAAESRRLAVALLVLCALLGLMAGWRMFLLATAGLILSLVYNFWAKNRLLVGNLIVALALALLFLTGYCVSGGGDLPVVPALAALLFLLAREFLKALADAEGDRLAGRRSVALSWGRARVLQVCLGLSALAAALLLVPAAASTDAAWRAAYLLTLVLTLVLPTLGAAIAIWRDQSLRRLRGVTDASRFLLLASLVTFLWLV